MKNKNRDHNVIKEIVKYMNQSNRCMFTKEEENEFIIEYKFMIENGEINNIIEVLKDEYHNSNDDQVLELINKLVINVDSKISVVFF